MGKLKIAGLSALAVFVVTFTVLGMGNTARAPERASTETPDRGLAEELLGETFSAYRNFTIPSFLEILSEDFSPDRMQMVNRIGDAFYPVEVLEINYFLNTVTGSGDTLAVDFNWEKQVYNRDTGNLDKSEGNALFVYKFQENKWKITQIRGDNPLLQ